MTSPFCLPSRIPFPDPPVPALSHYQTIIGNLRILSASSFLTVERGHYPRPAPRRFVTGITSSRGFVL